MLERRDMHTALDQTIVHAAATGSMQSLNIGVHIVHIVQLQQPVHQGLALGEGLIINSNLCSNAAAQQSQYTSN
jgi:hypothetical protein